MAVDELTGKRVKLVTFDPFGSLVKCRRGVDGIFVIGNVLPDVVDTILCGLGQPVIELLLIPLFEVLKEEAGKNQPREEDQTGNKVFFQR